MAEFFERLIAEQDPTRIATMAEAMPDPPDLAAIAAASSPSRVVRRPIRSTPGRAGDRGRRGTHCRGAAETETQTATEVQAEAARLRGPG